RSRSTCSVALPAHLKSVRRLRNARPGSLSTIAAAAAGLVGGSSGSVPLVLVYGRFGKIVQKAECVLPKISPKTRRIFHVARIHRHGSKRRSERHHRVPAVLRCGETEAH